MTSIPLFGAFCIDTHPIEHLGLSVRVAPLGARLRRSPLGVAFRGSIDMETLTTNAPFAGRVSRGPGGLRIDLEFLSDGGIPHALGLSLSLAHPTTVRSITDISGELSRLGARVGRAHVRLDWRRLLRL